MSISDIHKFKSLSLTGKNTFDATGFTLLAKASQRGRQNVLSFMMRHGADLNARCQSGWTALMVAVSQNQSGSVDSLIQHGAHISLLTDSCLNAIMIAAANGHANILRKLLGKDPSLIDLDIKNQSGWTALRYAVRWSHSDCVSVLLSSGASLDSDLDIIAKQWGCAEIITL